jgi:hypothetical protein
VSGFFRGGSESSYFQDFVKLEKDKHTLDHGVWDFMYSFDLEVAKEAGCYDAEDGLSWNGPVCLNFKKVCDLFIMACDCRL